MKNLKRLATSLVALVFVIAFSSCEKQPAADLQQDVVFSINNVTNTLKKGVVDGVNPDSTTIPVCSDETPAYVMLGMDSEDPIKLNVLSGLNDGTETQVLKLDVDVEHTINSFTVHAADGTIIWAAPMTGSHYAELWGLIGLEKKFKTVAFEKNAITIDVLCWEEYSYKEFGFNWFDFQEVTIKTMCFFGDVCTKFYDDFYNYPGSPYNRGDEVERGYDMPAIFEVIIRDKATGAVLNDLNMNSNASWYGEGAPLCIEYPDFGDTDNEEYTFEIYLAYPDGSYNLVHSQDFMAEDDQSTITGDDGVFDFVIGNCSYDGNDQNIELPPYLFLPEMLNASVVWRLGSMTAPFYNAFDITFNSIVGGVNSLYPEEFQAVPHTIGGYCGDIFNYIARNGTYDFDVYSSLGTVPSMYNHYPLGALNFLINQDEAIIASGADGADLQAMVWLMIHRDDEANGLVYYLEDGTPVTRTTAALHNRILSHTGIDVNDVVPTGGMTYLERADMLLTYNDYVPQTGEWSIVLLDPIEESDPSNLEGTKDLQLILVRVDP